MHVSRLDFFNMKELETKRNESNETLQQDLQHLGFKGIVAFGFRNSWLKHEWINNTIHFHKCGAVRVWHKLCENTEQITFLITTKIIFLLQHVFKSRQYQSSTFFARFI